jgi:N-acetylmuramic acid 6-phosphate etherase
MHATGANETAARSALEQAQFHVKTAIVSLLKQLPATAAQALLDAANGNLRTALQ